MGKRDELFGWYLSKLIYEWNPLKSRRKQNFYKKLIQKDSLCFDVGAHLGDRVSTWLNIGASVVAFEPQPKFAKYLTKKFKDVSSFHLENIGLSGSEGKMNFNVCNRYPTLSSLQGKEWEAQLNKNSSLNITFDAIHEIEVSTLDQMINKHGVPQFIKIDVEGHEHEVLKGLTQKVACLSFEFLSFAEFNMQQCLDYMEGLGYQKFNWSYAETFEFQSNQWLNRAELESSIKGFKKKSFSGDIYAHK